MSLGLRCQDWEDRAISAFRGSCIGHMEDLSAIRLYSRDLVQSTVKIRFFNSDDMIDLIRFV